MEIESNGCDKQQRKYTIKMGKFTTATGSHTVLVITGDITQMEVDGIVNASNTDLVLGSGVAGAVRTRGGPTIQVECDRIGPIPLGEAAVTGAGELTARYVIHAAGMRLGGSVSEQSLKETTRSSLLRADELRIKSLAFPAIGTGVGGFPLKRCAEIMVDTVIDHFEKGVGSLEKVYFVLYNNDVYSIFNDYLTSVTSLNYQNKGQIST